MTRVGPGIRKVRTFPAPRADVPAAAPSGVRVASRTAEIPFMQALMLALGARPHLRIHRQNCGKVPVRDHTGKTIRTFDAGPPNGAADISGIVAPEGWRIEIETKSSKGKASKQQKAWERMIVGHGGVYVLVAFDDSASLEDNVARAVGVVEQAIAARRA